MYQCRAATWRNGYAAACKAVYPGSIPGVASTYQFENVHGRAEPCEYHVEWLRFLKQIGREASKSLDPHLIADSYATHKRPKVKAWPERHPRFKMHFTPTSSSWLNLVERFFADPDRGRDPLGSL